MKVGNPRLPITISKEQFLEYLELLIVAAGGNLFQAAEDLEVTRPTIYRWRGPAGPPRKRRWYGLIFANLLTAYADLHHDILDRRSQGWRHDASRQILLKLDKVLPTLQAIADDNIATLYDIEAIYEDGTRKSYNKISRTRIDEEADIFYSSQGHQFLETQSPLRRITVWNQSEVLIWRWRTPEPFTTPFGSTPDNS